MYEMDLEQLSIFAIEWSILRPLLRSANTTAIPWDLKQLNNLWLWKNLYSATDIRDMLTNFRLGGAETRYAPGHLI
jgi:hypothetical protein